MQLRALYINTVLKKKKIKRPEKLLKRHSNRPNGSCVIDHKKEIKFET